MSDVGGAVGQQGPGHEERGEPAKNNKRASAATVLNAFVHEYRTDRDAYNSREKHRIWREWLTIIGLFIAALFAFLQWLELGKTDKNIERQANLVEGQLTAMQGQLAEMRTQSEITKSQMRANLNVVLAETDIPGPNNEFLGRYITPRWKNLGGTEAIGFSGWAQGHFFSPDIPPDFDFSRPEIERLPVMPNKPETSAPVWVPQGGEHLQGSIAFSGEDIKKALAGTGIFYIWLSVEYRDIFPDSPTHHITMCVRAIPRILGNIVVVAYPIYKPECNRRD
jgi:hypothetical protein